jgi:hypothetical protein
MNELDRTSSVTSAPGILRNFSWRAQQTSQLHGNSDEPRVLAHQSNRSERAILQ